MKKEILVLLFAACYFPSYSQSTGAMNILFNSVQASCKNETNKANVYHATIRETIAETKFLDKTETKIPKLQFVENRMLEIKNSTQEIITYLDSVKLDLLKKGGNDIQLSQKGAHSIIQRVYNNSCLPISLNIINLQNGQNTYSLNLKDFGGRLTKHRTNILSLIGDYEFAGKSRSFDEFSIPKWENFNQLWRIVRDSLKVQGTLEPGDPEIMSEIYLTLTSFQFYKEPLLSGTLLDKVATITSIQYNILEAYNMAVAHWSSRVSRSELILTDYKVICLAPQNANKGENIEFEILVVGYDAYNTPVISIDSATGNLNEKSEEGKVKLTMGNSNAEISGSIKIMTKMGIYHSYPWKTTIVLKD